MGFKHGMHNDWKNDDTLSEKEVDSDNSNLQIFTIMWDNY